MPQHHRGDLGLLALGVACTSTSPPLIAATAAPALAIAFWRTGAAALIFAPIVTARREAMPRREVLLAMLAGVLLAAHFGTFIPSFEHTTVASATALVCAQPVWAALLGRALGERLPARAWLGTAVSLSGVLLITGVDVSLDGDALLGDGLALLGGIFGGAYMVAGAFARRELSTLAYTSVCYGTSGAVLLAACVAAGQPLTGFAADDWARIAAITLLGQILGHSLYNLVLRSMSPTIVTLAGLFNVPGAAIIAALALGETPPAMAVPAMLLLLAGTAIVISARREPVPAATS